MGHFPMIHAIIQSFFRKLSPLHARLMYVTRKGSLIRQQPQGLGLIRRQRKERIVWTQQRFKQRLCVWRSPCTM